MIGYEMWFERARSIVLTRHKRVHVNASREWGTHFLVADMAIGHDPVIWLDLDEDDVDVVVSNKLSDAVQRAFRTRLFGYGLPLSYCWSRIADSRNELGTFLFALTGTKPKGVDIDPWSAPADKILVFGTDFHSIDSEKNPDSLVLENDLRLTWSEAEQIGRDRVSTARLRALYESSEGMYEVFLDALQQELGLPALERPYPDGFRPINGEKISPSPLIDSHVRRGHWLEAFEVAVTHCPDRVPELLQNAAEQYEDRGLMSRLHERLLFLPLSLRNNEQVAYWLIASAIAVNAHRSLIADLKRDVDIDSMPDVRALLAVHEPTKDSLRETEAAYNARRTLVTSRLYAFALAQFGEPEKSLELLKRALDEAQARAKWRDQVTLASSIAHVVALTGDYTASLTWAEWALKGFENFGVNDEIEKLYVTSQVRYMKLLVGDIKDLPELPNSLDPQQFVGVPTVDAVISTLGDVQFVSGDLDSALRHYRTNQRYQPREQAGHFVLDVCRALLAKGDIAEASDEADSALALAEGTSPLNVLKARLARALALEALNRDDSTLELIWCLDLSIELSHWDLAGIAAISLASHYLKRDSINAAGEVLLRCERGLAHLGDSGWTLFGQWVENLVDVRKLWTATQSPIQLLVMGEPKIRHGATDVVLSLRNAEILTVLAMHPDGLSGELLADKLYSREVSPSTLKASLSRLRNVVPIKSQPYAIDAFFVSDFSMVERLLERGSLSEALVAYRGPLLRDSSAPAIVAYRDYLEEAVRQAAMRTVDVDSLFEFAQQRPDDLEVWERLREVMSSDDVRISFVEARILRLHSEWGLSDD